MSSLPAERARPTLVLGASPNPARYAWQAVALLQQYGHPVWAAGVRQGDILGVPIQHPHRLAPLEGLHSISLYLNPQVLEQYRDWIIGQSPRRVIFNPGTEFPAFRQQLEAAGIEARETCTLVMLRAGLY
jgi:hypothetical protein